MQTPLHMAAELNKTNALKVIAKFRNVLDPNIPGGKKCEKTFLNPFQCIRWANRPIS
jgi:hypothetical protein